MATRISHQDMVKAVLDSKAVDFAAIGKVVSQVGPTLSLADEPWESFCLTMRYFIRIFIVNGPVPPWHTIGNLEQLRDVAGDLKGGR